MTEFVEKVAQKAKEILESNPNQSVAHKWDHTYRVYKRAEEIAKRMKDEKIDIEALRISCLLHDIVEPYDRKQDHVELSLREAERILKEIDYPEDRIQKVLNIISEHSLESDKTPSSIEAKILFDADKLEGSGAIGIARVFSFCGQNKKTPAEAIEWYKEEIRKATPRLQTEIGRSIAQESFEYVKSFFERYSQEEQGILQD